GGVVGRGEPDSGPCALHLLLRPSQPQRPRPAAFPQPRDERVVAQGEPAVVGALPWVRHTGSAGAARAATYFLKNRPYRSCVPVAPATVTPKYTPSLAAATTPH